MKTIYLYVGKIVKRNGVRMNASVMIIDNPKAFYDEEYVVYPDLKEKEKSWIYLDLAEYATEKFPGEKIKFIVDDYFVPNKKQQYDFTYQEKEDYPVDMDEIDYNLRQELNKLKVQ